MNTIKITSGKFRGRAIASPNSKATHPMGAREKLALFNMLNDYLTGANVLDAYAGSGALGIEALSRGANQVTFIERNHHAAQTIRKNLAELGLAEVSTIYECSVKDFLTSERFDIILADPPYSEFEINGVKKIAKFLKESGILILSHPNEAPELADLTLQKTRAYANARISVYIK